MIDIDRTPAKGLENFTELLFQTFTTHPEVALAMLRRYNPDAPEALVEIIPALDNIISGTFEEIASCRSNSRILFELPLHDAPGFAHDEANRRLGKACRELQVRAKMLEKAGSLELADIVAKIAKRAYLAHSASDLIECWHEPELRKMAGVPVDIRDPATADNYIGLCFSVDKFEKERGISTADLSR